MREPRMICLCLVPLRRAEVQAVQLVALKLQQLALGCHCPGILAKTDTATAQNLPIAIKDRELLRISRYASITIQQHALHIGTEQRLMRVLAMNIEQLFARFAQLLKGGTAPVDEAARTPASIQYAAQQAHIFIARQV